MKDFKFTLSTPWVLEVGGGVFFAFLLRWTDILFSLRNLLLPLSGWTGISGAEYIGLILGRYSTLGGVAFILTTGLTGGVNLIQLGITLLALGVWEIGKRNGKAIKFGWLALGTLGGLGFLSLKISFG